MADVIISASSVAENATGEIATLTCEGAASYRLTGDAGVLDTFEVVGDKIVVKQGAVLDYEIQSTYHFGIEALDTDGNPVGSLVFSDDNPFTISNLNDNAPDTIRLDGQTSLDIPESTQVEAFIGTLSAIDADGDSIANYEVVGGDDYFVIVNDGGTWKVQLAAGVDHEVVAQQKHTLTIRAIDGGGLSTEQDITINVTNVNDTAPSGITLSNTVISESAKTGDIVGELSATDPDGDLITGFSLDAQSSAFFEVDQVEGKWVVKLKAGVDYENVAQREHVLKIIATDGVHESTQNITITVTNENDNRPTTVRLNDQVSADVSEGTAAGSDIGVLSATDPDGNPITGYEIVGENTLFEVAEAGGRWVIRLKAGLDYEGIRQHVLSIRATDGVNKSDVQEITINVTNANDNAPTGIVLSNTSLSESAKVDDVIGVLSATDVDGDSITGYALAEPNDFFYLKYENGTWQVRLKAGVDYESATQHVLKITATDGVNTSAVHEITIKVVNANEAPTDIVMTGGAIGDNSILGTPVATLAGQDPDKGDALRYTIVEDETGATAYDHPYFGISGNEIVVASDLVDAPIGENLPVYVKVTDAKGLFVVRKFMLTVTHVNEAPEVTAESLEVLDGARGGTLVAVISAEDADDDALTYKLSEASAQWFTLVDNGDSTWNVVVKQGITLRSDKAAFQSFVVEVSDTAGNTTKETVFLNINQNQEPEATFEFLEVDKNTPASTLVGTLVGYDPEGQAVSYTLSDESADLFTLAKNANGTYSVFVKQGVTLDYYDEAQHGFTVMATDGFNSFEESFELVFKNYAPIITNASSIVVREGVGGDTAVAKFTVTDPDYDAFDCTLSAESEALFDLVDDGNGNYDVVVRQGIRLDYENSAHHIVKMIVSDGSNTFSRDFIVNLTDEIDVITGTAKADGLNGTAGRDIIKGLAGNDSLAGNTGNDTLFGGAGKDVLNGGDGQDVFVFDAKPNKKTNLDKVIDFKVVDDSIWLENKIFTKLGKKGSEAAPA